MVLRFNSPNYRVDLVFFIDLLISQYWFSLIEQLIEIDAQDILQILIYKIKHCCYES